MADDIFDDKAITWIALSKSSNQKLLKSTANYVTF